MRLSTECEDRGGCLRASVQKVWKVPNATNEALTKNMFSNAQ